MASSQSPVYLENHQFGAPNDREERGGQHQDFHREQTFLLTAIRVREAFAVSFCSSPRSFGRAREASCGF